jgi:hypothetical protein
VKTLSTADLRLLAQIAAGKRPRDGVALSSLILHGLVVEAPAGLELTEAGRAALAGAK